MVLGLIERIRRELDSVAHAGLEVGVAVELDKVKVDAHDLRCLP